MDKQLIRIKCEKILLEKRAGISEVLNTRIQKVYQKHAEQLGEQIDYELLTSFTSDLLMAFSGVVSEVMVQLFQELLSDDISEED